MDIIHPDIESYLRGLSPSRDPILREMERLAEGTGFPIVGPLVGRFLQLMARATGARRVFEFGSGFGYSAYWFLQGMGEDGRVCLTDDEEENGKRAEDFLGRAGSASRIRIEVGDAIEIIDRQTEIYDIIFVDCEKARYPAALEKALPRLRPGGLLLADNVLWSGSVVSLSEEPSVIGIQRFNRLAAEHPGLITSILPLRDGVSVSLKI